MIQGDSGEAFIAKVTLEVSGSLRIQWELHASTEKTEKMNYIFKMITAKICQETNLTWQ